MIAITGITGRIGGQFADRLLSAGVDVRAVIRNPEKGTLWKSKGCEIAVTAPTDTDALTAAFAGADTVFVLPAPIFDPAPGFSEAYAAMTAHRDAVQRSGVGRVLYLSTIGAQARQTNLLSQHTIGESIFRTLQIPVTYLRPAWFIENVAWDISSARSEGMLQSALQPLDKLVPMVAVRDISKLASELIQDGWEGHRIVELEGPQRISPIDLAAALSRHCGRDVTPQIRPRNTWESLFFGQGMANPYPRIRMLDGFNEGWIEFEGGIQRSRKGSTTVDEVIAELLANAS